MRRRDFITLLGGTAAAWPLAARAQQPALPVVGWLHAVSAPSQEANVAALRKGLGEHGLIEGRDFAIEYRFANNDYNRLPELAADLVHGQVAVILALGGAVTTRAAKAATTKIPIVFVQGQDPVAMGLVASLNRPGGNVTGITFLSAELGPKRLGLLKEVVPTASRYALLVNPNDPATDLVIAALRKAAASIGREIEVFGAGSIGEIDSAFAELVRQGRDALVVGANSFLATRRVQITTLAAIHRLPAIYYTRDSVEVGGLMSYGADVPDAIYQSATYVGRILKGEKPADLPVQQSTKFDFVINLSTAKALGLEVSPALLAHADGVIE
jgi:putative ABC transport system substrate-binding protein